MEVPVYYYNQSSRQLVAGHIDLLQTWPERIRILDYKPGAACENPAKVVSQLTQYANALRYRASLDGKVIECGYFDAQDAYFLRCES